MTLIDEPLLGVKILRPFVTNDYRGTFVKPYHMDQLAKHGIKMTIQEEFYSISSAWVLRGMHFQIPPQAHQKIVYCTSGRVIDVLLDLRLDSQTYGKAVSFELSETNKHIVYIPIGIAHGFLSLEDNSCLVYKTDIAHHPDADCGILWSSFGFEWPNPPNHQFITSVRDQKLSLFNNFISPF